MKTYKLIPQLRENCVIEGNESRISEFKIGDVIFLISNKPTKVHSIISKIEGKNISNDPKIYIDKRNIGKFAENDEVIILKYNPAEAIRIQICVSEDYSVISKGDWTTNIKSSVLDKLVDLGDEISFLIPWEGSAPIVGTGIVNYTLPNPPVIIGERTRIFLDKKSKEELSQIKMKMMLQQEERVNILEQQMEQDTFNIIKKIKQEEFPSKGQKYKFKATNPQKLFDSLQSIFQGLQVIEEPFRKTYDDEKQDFFASAVFMLRKHDSFQLIDLQITSSENSGNVILWVTGENEGEIIETLQHYDERIKELKQGLEERVKILSIKCPECGGDLPIKNMDLEGIIECDYCGKVSRIPKSLRY
ncbi:MAG: hypothetical protein EU550_00565 [Promethearchaeota archaeon]|nr:MAG: hypothetical protein EU550_00565 [Candidatus Lokiarchaeota archaeon]